MDKKLVGWMHPESSSQWLRSPMDSGIQCTFSKFAGDTKLGGTVDTPYVIQRNVHKLKKWSNGSLMELNKTTCKILPLGQAGRMMNRAKPVLPRKNRC